MGVDEDDEGDGENATLGDGTSGQITWEGLREFGIDVSVESGSVKDGSVDSWRSWMISRLEA